MQLGIRLMLAQKLRRQRTRRLQQVDVLFQIGEAQQRHAALPRAMTNRE